jgi:hypothetical protein
MRSSSENELIDLKFFSLHGFIFSFLEVGMFRSVTPKICIAALLVSFSVVNARAAFILPSDSTGSVGTDPGAWAPGFPGINTNVNSGVSPSNTVAFSTVRSLTPWNRPTDSLTAIATETTYQGWDVFSSATLANAPNAAVVPNQVDADPQNPNGTAQLTQLIPGAFATGGGNIYNPTGPTAFSLTVPGFAHASGFSTNFLLQVRAATGDFDVSSFTVNGLPLSGLSNFNHQVINTTFYPAGQGPTAAIDHTFEFSLPTALALNTITFGSTVGGGLSFDKLSVDTIVTPVPEPGVIGTLVGLGLVGMGIRRRMKA